MEEVSVQIDAITLDKTATVVVDIESLAQSAERSSGSPKVTRVLSRKWSYRTERLPSTEEEHVDESSKRTLVRVNSELEALKLSLVGNKTLPPTIPCLSGSGTSDAADGWNKRLHRLMAINPRKVLCIFATVTLMFLEVILRNITHPCLEAEEMRQPDIKPRFCYLYTLCCFTYGGMIDHSNHTISSAKHPSIPRHSRTFLRCHLTDIRNRLLCILISVCCKFKQPTPNVLCNGGA